MLPGVNDGGWVRVRIESDGTVTEDFLNSPQALEVLKQWRLDTCDDLAFRVTCPITSQSLTTHRVFGFPRKGYECEPDDDDGDE